MPKVFLAMGDALRASFVEVSTRVTLHISSDHLLLRAPTMRFRWRCWSTRRHVLTLSGRRQKRRLTIERIG
jgi:hypothetical protein